MEKFICSAADVADSIEKTINDISKIATPYLKKLNNELGDSVYLGVKNERNVIF